MNVGSLSKEEIRKRVGKAEHISPPVNPVKVLFVPNTVDEHNFQEICNTYKSICWEDYETVVVIESYTGYLNKKLAMPSNKTFKTRFGEVAVNDFLRNEFCDEEDDFFIYDEGFSKDMSLFSQLPILQACLDDFDIVSLQIGDYDPLIVKELAYVLDELMINRNALIVFCCDIPASNREELEKLRKLVIENDDPGLMHYLNSSDKQVKGARAFMTGLLVARSWNLDVELLDQIQEASNICGFAKLGESQPARV